MQTLQKRARRLALLSAVIVGILVFPNGSNAEARYSARASFRANIDFIRPEGAHEGVGYSVSAKIISSGKESTGTGSATIDLNETDFMLATEGGLSDAGSVSSFADAEVTITAYNPTDVGLDFVFRSVGFVSVQSFSDANEAGSAAASTEYIFVENIFGSEEPYYEDINGDEYRGMYQLEDGSYYHYWYKSYYDSLYVPANSSASFSKTLHVEGKLNSTVEQLSYIEAESMALSGGYAVEDNAAASGGKLIRRLASGGDPAVASTQYAGPAGTYDIAVSYFDENDGNSSLAFVLNGQVLDQWIADEDPVCSDCASPGASTLRARVVARDIRLSPGDEIALQGTAEHYEYARFDKITLAPASSITLEAEAMTLEGGYAVEKNAAASGGELIRRLDSGGYAATASTQYAGAAGTYDIAVSYFDESDGVSNLAFVLNGQMLDQWAADEDPLCSDCASPGASTLRTRVVAKDVRLLPGDELVLQGTGEHYEYARFDKITLSPLDVTTVEAESMALDGRFSVESNAASSGGLLIRGIGSADSTPGQASTPFMGSKGTYDITVTYFDEYDGISSMAAFLNNLPLDQWLADENPVCAECASPNEKTLRSRVVAKGVEMSPGDEIRLESTINQYEYGRFDKIDFTRTLSR